MDRYCLIHQKRHLQRKSQCPSIWIDSKTNDIQLQDCSDFKKLKDSLSESNIYRYIEDYQDEFESNLKEKGKIEKQIQQLNDKKNKLQTEIKKLPEELNKLEILRKKF